MHPGVVVGVAVGVGAGVAGVALLPPPPPPHAASAAAARNGTGERSSDRTCACFLRDAGLCEYVALDPALEQAQGGDRRAFSYVGTVAWKCEPPCLDLTVPKCQCEPYQSYRLFLSPA